VLEIVVGVSLDDQLTQASDSLIVISRCQVEIAAEVSELKEFYVYSIDYSKFNQTVPLAVLGLACEKIGTLLPSWTSSTKWWKRTTRNIGFVTRCKGLLYISLDILVSKIHKIYVHGNDNLVILTRPMDIDLIVKLISDSLEIQIKFDEGESSVSGIDKVYFLGSM
jgi:hypothetical protein